MTTGDFGDDEITSTLTKVRLRFLSEPNSATVTGQTKDGAGESGVAAGSGSMSDSKFDLFQDGHWHRLSFLFSGNTEVSAMQPTVKRSGRR